MEWFVSAQANIPVAQLQREIRADNLAVWCALPPAMAVLLDTPAGSDWAASGVHRELIRDGLRFSVPGAHAALQWTLTAGGQQRAGTVALHCSVNVAAPDAASVAAVNEFMQAWRVGLEAGVQRLQEQRDLKAAAASAPCAPWFG